MNVHQMALAALREEDPVLKTEKVEALSKAWQRAEVKPDTDHRAETIAVPGRPPKPELVHPRSLKARKLTSPEGHAAFVHALAHIEFNAINLALDAVYRFPGLPDDYYGDWITVAVEEAYHHRLLVEHLRSLGHAYGDFPAHDGLWDMALRTDRDLLLRMALVPRVFEARGLDVTPPMIERLKQHGDERGAEILGIILNDEIGHVAIGNRWYHWACEQRGADPVSTFLQLVDEYMPGRVNGPFHTEARLAAGFTEAELKQLEEK